MGSLFRQKKTFYTLDGKRVKAGTHGAEKRVEESEKWYGLYKDVNGQWQRVPLSPDKKIAEKMLTKIENNVSLGKVGYGDPYADTKKRTLSDVLGDYLAYLRQRDRSPKHIADVEIAIKKCERETGITALSDLTVAKLDTWLASLKGGARTRNKKRGFIVGMFNWLVEKGMLGENLVERATVAEGPVLRKRRSLSVEDFVKFLTAARTRPLTEAKIVRQGPNKGKPLAKVSESEEARLRWIGENRYLLYLTAYYTGLRLDELRSLRVYHLHFDAPQIVLDGDFTKNGEPAILPLRPALAELLKTWCESKQPSDAVFHVPNDSNVSENIQKDLAMAGIPYKDAQGRQFGFHSIRKTFGTHLRLAKIDVGVSQELMRHSDVRLTLQTYKDAAAMPLVEAVDALPNVIR